MKSGLWERWEHLEKSLEIHKKRPSAKRSLGQHGEQLAEQLLVSKGFTIVAKNWRGGKIGEIDLIATQPAKDLMVFVEVKTRRSNTYGTPMEAVTPEKQQRMMMLAERYLQLATEDPALQARSWQVRFDVVAVLQSSRAGGLSDVRHLENAFEQ